MFEVQKVFYDSDNIHIREVLATYSAADLMAAYRLFNQLDNAVLLDLDTGSVIDKKSSGFDKLTIKQYYLSLACDLLDIEHKDYSFYLETGRINQEIDDSYNRILHKLLMEGLSVDDPGIRNPLINELVIFLLGESNHEK